LSAGEKRTTVAFTKPKVLFPKNNTRFGPRLKEKVCALFLSGSEGQVGMWWLNVKSAEDMPRVIAAINKSFENISPKIARRARCKSRFRFVSRINFSCRS